MGGGGRAYKRNKKILWNDEINLNVSEKHIKGRTIRKLIRGGGGVAGEVQKKFSRKGK